MELSVSGTFKIDPESREVLEAWFTPDSEFERALMLRVKEASRQSGKEVVLDLTEFDIEWSPVYWHEADRPVAWVNAKGERREGPDYPS